MYRIVNANKQLNLYKLQKIDVMNELVVSARFLLIFKMYIYIYIYICVCVYVCADAIVTPHCVQCSSQFYISITFIQIYKHHFQIKNKQLCFNKIVMVNIISFEYVKKNLFLKKKKAIPAYVVSQYLLIDRAMCVKLGQLVALRHSCKRHTCCVCYIK